MSGFAEWWNGLTKEEKLEARSAMLKEAQKTMSPRLAIQFVNNTICNGKRGALDGYVEDSNPQSASQVGLRPPRLAQISDAR